MAVGVHHGYRRTIERGGRGFNESKTDENEARQKKTPEKRTAYEIRRNDSALSPTCQLSTSPTRASTATQLLEELARGYRSKHVDLEAVTEFDPDKNSGNISIEVILLPKVKHAETTRKTTTPGNPKAGVVGLE